MTAFNVRDIDVDVRNRSAYLPVTAGPILRAEKWKGGTFVMYATSTTGEEFTVERSDGNNVAGFLLNPSEGFLYYAPGPDFGSVANFTNYQPALGVGGQNVVTMVVDGVRAHFRYFEQLALAGGVRNVAATYALNDSLYVSENGYLCNDSEAELMAAGILTPNFVGIVSAIPSTRNGGKLCADLRL